MITAKNNDMFVMYTGDEHITPYRNGVGTIVFVLQFISSDELAIATVGESQYLPLGSLRTTDMIGRVGEAESGQREEINLQFSR